MSQRFCPECGGALFYDAPVKLFACKSCGLYGDREEFSDIKDKHVVEMDDGKRKRKAQSEYLEWWLSSKETKSKL